MRLFDLAVLLVFAAGLVSAISNGRIGFAESRATKLAVFAARSDGLEIGEFLGARPSESEAQSGHSEAGEDIRHILSHRIHYKVSDGSV